MPTTARPLTARARRLLATLALVAQWLAVAAPLIDVHPASQPAGALATGQLQGDHGFPPGDRHDASRCPGCIAQLIHAVPVPTARIGALDLELRRTPESPAAARPVASEAGTLHSRAPPPLG